MARTPVSVVADLLGFASDEYAILEGWTRDFVSCLSPSSTSKQLDAAGSAAVLLRSRMQSLLESTRPRSGSLLAHVRTQAAIVGWSDSTTIIANLVGLLSQSYEATSGLIGNALVALASHAHLLDEVRARADGWHELVCETSRYDSPVQNTRRYVHETLSIGGSEVAAGSTILLVLAAANRDPAANPSPQEFRLGRPSRCVFTFSRGAHACPGEVLAHIIAAAAVAVLAETWPDGWLAKVAWSWRPSANGRLPALRFLKANGILARH